MPEDVLDLDCGGAVGGQVIEGPGAGDVDERCEVDVREGRGLGAHDLGGPAVQEPLELGRCVLLGAAVNPRCPAPANAPSDEATRRTLIEKSSTEVPPCLVYVWDPGSVAVPSSRAMRARRRATCFSCSSS